MPVPLPPAPVGGTPLPQEPADPPTLEDVYNAVEYTLDIRLSHDQQIAADDDVAHAAVYETSVALARAADNAAPPASFEPTLRNVLDEKLAPIKIILAKTHNLQCGDGLLRPFEIVPFVDGTLPTEPPHNLPALRNVQAILELDDNQATDYVAGYGLPYINLILDRKQAIGRAIDCVTPIRAG